MRACVYVCVCSGCLRAWVRMFLLGCVRWFVSLRRRRMHAWVRVSDSVFICFCVCVFFVSLCEHAFVFPVSDQIRFRSVAVIL